MKKLEINDWLTLNSVIYKIYTTEKSDEMRSNLMENLRMLLDFDAADFFLSDCNGGLCDGVGYNSDLEKSVKYKCDIMNSGKCIVFRETDIIKENERCETQYYKMLYVPNRWHFSIHIVLAYDKKFLGIISLYRTIGKDNFNYDDIFILDMLKEHIAYRLFTEYNKKKECSDKISIKTAVEKFKLTKREETILQELLAGKDNTSICDDLVISSNTLKKHIMNIYRKLGINNRVQMFKMIKEKG